MIDDGYFRHLTTEQLKKLVREKMEEILSSSEA
jgi:hypothetical protein